MSYTYFIADLHLTDDQPEITDAFMSFMKEQAPHADALYVLGDLFEYWIGDDNKTTLNNRVAAALKSLSEQIPVYFIAGNRDFLVGQRYAKACGMTLLDEHVVVDLYGTPTLILHGDTLCTLDVDYQKFRKKSRTWWWQKLVLLLPLWKRKQIAENGRKKSQMKQKNLDAGITDVTPSEVVKRLEEFSVQRMIHGHTHRPAIHDVTANGHPAQRIVLGDWYSQSSTLKVSKDKTELLNTPFTD